MLKRLKVWQVLACIGVAFLLPIMLLATLFITTSYESINSSARERAGSSYLTAVWEAFHQVAKEKGSSVAPEAIATLEEGGERFDAALGTAAARSAFSETLGRGATDDAKTSGRALIRAIADNSNLTLDPNLDSYYAMDVVTSRLPDLVLALSELQSAAEEMIGMESFNSKVRLAAANGAAAAAHEAVRASLAAGYGGNADGSLRRTLSGPEQELARTMTVLLDKTALRDVLGNGPSADELARDSGAIYVATARLWAASNIELQRLLDARVNGLYGKLWFHLGLAGGLLLATVVLATLLGNALAKAIAEMAATVKRMSQGERDGEIPFIANKNEVGTIARALSLFRDRLNELDAAQAARVAEDLHKQETHRDEMMKLAAAFERTVRGTVSALSEATRDLGENVDGLAALATNGASSAEQASVTAAQSLDNMRSIAAATEEMSSSVRELTMRVGEAANIAKAAEERAKNSEKTVDTLAEAATRIGDVVALISDVAEQTNLLALNATIEAARAGEAGRGFAVVAQEVKALAAQTTKATDEIAQQINRIQSASQGAVGDIRAIVTTIVDISRLSMEIAAAMEEQEAAVAEVARNTDAVSLSADEVATTISSLSDVAQETGRRSRTGSEAVQALSARTRDLNDAVDQFLGELQVA